MKTTKNVLHHLPTALIITALLGFSLLGCGSDDDNEPAVAMAPKTISMSAILSGAQSPTPVDTNSTGYGTVVVDPATRVISGGINYTGVTATAAHIHSGMAGINGGSVVTLTVDNTTHSAMIPDGTVLTHSQYDDLIAGGLYFNVHSAANSGGEIRGQIGRIVMTAMLDGMQQTTPVTTMATGSGMVVVDPATLGISGSIRYDGVTATVAHIHSGAAGVNGGPVITLTVDNNTNTASIPGGSVLTAPQYADLLSGKMYFNVHSAANTGGEIRGQIGPVAVVATLDGTQEVPAITTMGSGTGVLVVDPITRMLSGGVAYTGVNATAAHIHSGAAGTNGTAAVTLTVDGNTSTAVVPAATVLTQSQYDDLLTGNLYVNIHSTVYMSGEIRGQLSLP